MAAPKCFISYSWDTPEHEAWVLELATKLRAKGVEALLDKFELKLGHDLAQFMESSVRESDFVLLICTPPFATKADSGQGGVGYEKQIVTGEIFNGAPQEKFVGVLRAGDAKSALPSYLKSKLYVDFRDHARFAASFEQLLRHVFGEPVHKAPPIGERPSFASSQDTQTSSTAPPIEALFSESFDDEVADLSAMQHRYGKLWTIGRDGPWTGSVEGGRYRLVNHQDPDAIHYRFISIHGPDGAPVDLVYSRLAVRVRIAGFDPNPFSGAGLLFDFDERTRFYSAFCLTQFERDSAGPMRLTSVIRDQRGFHVLQSVEADGLAGQREVTLSVNLRADHVELVADGRTSHHVGVTERPRQSRWPGLIAVGRGDVTFDDFRITKGL